MGDDNPLIRSETRSVTDGNAEHIETHYWLSARGWAVILVGLAALLVTVATLVMVAMLTPELIDAVDQLGRSMDGLGRVINS